MHSSIFSADPVAPRRLGHAAWVILQAIACATADLAAGQTLVPHGGENPATREVSAGKPLRTGAIADLPIDAKMFPTPREYFSSPIQRTVYKAYTDRKGMGRLPVNTLTPEACVAYQDAPTTYVYVPPAYDGKEAYGVYLHNSPHTTGIRPSEAWQKVMQELKLIYISPNHGGNDVADLRRVVLALDSLATVKRLYQVDPRRVYVGGLSGGGFVGMLCQMYYPEVFSGAISHAAQSYLPGDSSNGHFAGLSLSDARRPPRDKLGWVVISGSKDQNYEVIKQTSEAWARAKFNYKFIDQEGMGHENASADSLKQALLYVAAVSSESSAAVKKKTPETKPKPNAVAYDATRPSRTWTAQMGSVLEASLLRAESGYAYLKDANGAERKVPIATLIQSDQDYIASLIIRP